MADPPLDDEIVVGPDGLVRIAGLGVPAQLAPRLIAAIRGVHPSLTEGLSDAAAVRAVLHFWVTSTLVQWEEKNVLAPLEEAVIQTQRAFDEAAEEARTRAAQAAASIQGVPQ